MFYSLVRFAFFEDLVGAIVCAPLGENLKKEEGPTYDSEAETLVGQLGDFAGHYAWEELKKHRNPPWRWPYNFNIDRRTDERNVVKESSRQCRLLLISGLIWGSSSLGLIALVGCIVPRKRPCS